MPTPPQTRPTIALDGTCSNEVVARPKDLLGPGETFDAYRAACHRHAFAYRTGERGFVGSEAKAPDLAMALHEAGFRVVPDARVQAVLSRAADGDRAARADVDRACSLAPVAPFPYQREDAKVLATSPCKLVAHEMRVGKTPISLLAIPFGGCALVVAPKIAKATWGNEVSRWRPDLSAVVLRPGSRHFRWPEPGEVVVTNYEGVPSRLGPPPRPVCLVLDEAHAVKNPKAARTKAVRALAHGVLARGGKCWLLTGTPLMNRQMELWNVLQTARMGDLAFGDFARFMHVAGGYRGTWGIEWGPTRKPLWPLLQKVCLRRTRKEVLPQLPPKTWEELYVDIEDAETRRMCDTLARQLEKAGVRIEDALDLTIQTASAGGISFDLIARVKAALATAKIPALMGIVEEHEEDGEPLVVFCSHRAPIEFLATRPGWRVITGTSTDRQRADAVVAFQAGDLKGLALTIRSSGVALDLTRAHREVFVDRDWNPAINAQAEDRCVGVAQRRGLVVTTLVANHPMDVRVVRVLLEKQRMIHDMIDRRA